MVGRDVLAFVTLLIRTIFMYLIGSFNFDISEHDDNVRPHSHSSQPPSFCTNNKSVSSRYTFTTAWFEWGQPTFFSYRRNTAIYYKINWASICLSQSSGFERQKDGALKCIPGETSKFALPFNGSLFFSMCFSSALIMWNHRKKVKKKKTNFSSRSPIVVKGHKRMK